MLRRVWCCTAGEAPCIATYWVTRYWQLLLLRLLTGLSLGGILPLVLSLLGDLFSVRCQRREAYTECLRMSGPARGCSVHGVTWGSIQGLNIAVAACEPQIRNGPTTMAYGPYP